MSTWYAKNATMNWSDANAWNSAADGSGTDQSHPLPAGDTANLSGKTVTLDVDVTVALITATDGTGYLDVSGTRTINGNVTYSGTSTSGMVRVGTGNALTVNGKITCDTTSGYVLVGSGSGVLTVTNSGATAIEHSAGSGGRVIKWGSTGNLTVTGDVVRAATGNNNTYCLFIDAACTVAITGNVTVAGNGNCIYIGVAAALTITGDISASSAATSASSGRAVYMNHASATVTFAGNMASNKGYVLELVSGTVTWIGSRTLGAGVQCMILQTGGTLNLATGAGALDLAVSGMFALWTSGTVTTTSGANTAFIALQSASAQAAVIGASVTITGPTLPTEGNVEAGSGTYGYLGAPLTPTLVPVSRYIKLRSGS